MPLHTLTGTGSVETLDLAADWWIDDHISSGRFESPDPIQVPEPGIPLMLLFGSAALLLAPKR